MTPDEIMKDAEPVPFIAYEAVQIRGDVREKRLCSINKLLGILLGILFITSCAIIYLVHRSCMDKIEKNNQRWISYLEQYDFASYESSQDGEGLNILGDRNGVNYYGPEVEGEHQDAEER
jgi:hypothetical protein